MLRKTLGKIKFQAFGNWVNSTYSIMSFHVKNVFYSRIIIRSSKQNSRFVCTTSQV